MSRGAAPRRGPGLLLLVVCASCGSPPPPPRAAEVVTSAPHVAAPLPKPACGEVDVEDHSVPSAPDHVVLVRETVRQQLAALGACARPFRLHLNFTLEAAGLGQVRAKLSLLVYRTTGALAGEVPTTLTGDRSSASDVVATETLLRVGAESAARRYVRTFL